jgi:shikimate kinase
MLIFLVNGLPGAGKSSIFSNLVEQVNLPKIIDCMDLDDEIAGQWSVAASSLGIEIEKRGFLEFRKAELKQVKALCQRAWLVRKGLILFLGGGSFTSELLAWSKTNKMKVVNVNLETDVENSLQISRSDSNRPISKNKTESELRDIFTERLNLMKSSDHFILSALSTEEKVVALIKLYQSYI